MINQSPCTYHNHSQYCSDSNQRKTSQLSQTGRHHIQNSRQENANAKKTTSSDHGSQNATDQLRRDVAVKERS